MADDYIRKADVIDELRKDVMGGLNYESIIDSLPPADAVQVRRGRWIKEWWHGERVRRCSICNITQTVTVYIDEVKFNYCPYCGAKMGE